MTEHDGAVLTGTALHKSFGATPALRGVDVAIAPGEQVAVTGPSGSGKSTLLHCLAGVTSPDSGFVSLAGHRLDSLSEHQRTRVRRVRIGLVLQFGQLVPDLTAVENVALPLLLEGRRRPDAEQAARGWLERLGVGDRADVRPLELSGGEQQRVAIARGLVTSPDVVLADEPTGALDTVTGEQALQVLVEATRETGAALVVVTHDHRVAAHMERGIALRDGRVELVREPGA
ncbi:ABC transporter ATP-binding protein [Nocardioides flavescens]|uniref:ATP-binding cassette domain-containing protein n=1 Tax=Nocardioides flavescens TaxID=2691959 RepID=A0A6L7F3A3_9ACTN|nr:ABC transporter ATP-binding protein [Nocardioides flavescens]MXG91584.1 ATP-binding cassette domain-containing protein [Nocardioides flavescens]